MRSGFLEEPAKRDSGEDFSQNPFMATPKRKDEAGAKIAKQHSSKLIKQAGPELQKPDAQQPKHEDQMQKFLEQLASNLSLAMQ